MEIKFVSSSTNLLNHLQAISKVIKNKNTMPILDCFLFEIEGKNLKAIASDLETTMETNIELETVSGEGSFAISAKMLLDTLREFPEQPLTFLINTDTLAVQITSANGKFSIVGQQSETFPKTSILNENHGNLSISLNILKSGLNKTYFATADDELRPVMNGIFFDVKPNKLTFVASDSHKLVQAEYTQNSSAGETSFILPKKPASLLLNILPKENSDNNIEIQFDDRNVYFQLSKYKMVCRLAEGKYPNYRTVIPTENINKLTIDRLSFMTTLRRVNVFSNQASNLVKIALKENDVTISAQDIDFSTSAMETLPCQYEGSQMNIGFKSTFLLEILQNIDSSEVILALGDHTRAGLIFPVEQKDDEDLLMLLTPLALNE